MAEKFDRPAHAVKRPRKKVCQFCVDRSEFIVQLKSIVADATVIGISARNGKNVDLLRSLIYDAANIPSITDNDVIVTSSRHYEALLKAHVSMERTIESIDFGISGDLLSEDLRLCLDAIAEITGKGIITSAEVLSNIFSHFCIGK